MASIIALKKHTALSVSSVWQKCVKFLNFKLFMLYKYLFYENMLKGYYQIMSETDISLLKCLGIVNVYGKCELIMENCG